MNDEELLARARAACTRAYAPYSGFEVGAAVLADGELFDGANVECASLGLTVCAERNAVMRAVLEGSREIQALAVVTPNSPPAPPCGLCLQSLMEFTRDPNGVSVLLGNHEGEVRRHTLAELLPFAFRPTDLARRH